ncbi:MAG TPA: sugar-binding transcriptional regulator [Dongiaceae bacterium]|jgi:DNA-binding transcriptional regulator LsrR (DeoR family)|nr:sugar-binding transcriptional regulator [Dongiaceae bacterium]
MARIQDRRAAQARIKRSELMPPAEFAGDPIVWAAWLYYEERMTQEEIAEQLGVSRATVVNFLQEARDRNVVTIAVASEHLQSVRIARELSRRWGLASCVVIPEDDGRMPVYDRVGRAGARLLAETLEPSDVVGVSWGRTVLALSESLPEMKMPGVSVVQIAGSAIGTAEFSPELCTSNIAYRIGARCVNLYAPGIVSKPEIKKLFMQETALVEQFKVIRACTKVLFGVANLSAASWALRSGYMTPEKLRPYLKGGAVAVMSGRFLDAEGKTVLGPLDEQMIGLTIPEIARIPERICVAGGIEKVEAIAAVLRGGYATVLVTDEPTARALVALH